MHRLALRKLRASRQRSRDLNRARRLWPTQKSRTQEAEGAMRRHTVIASDGGPSHVTISLVVPPLFALLAEHTVDMMYRREAKAKKQRKLDHYAHMARTQPALMQRYADKPVDKSLYRRIAVNPLLAAPYGVDPAKPGTDYSATLQVELRPGTVTGRAYTPQLPHRLTAG